jgi:uncharacterized membrane protein
VIVLEKIAIVFVDSEKKAYDASKAFKELDDKDDITIYSEAVIEKTADGKVKTKEAGDDFPISTVGGTAVGGLIGLLEDPIGALAGAAAGAALGAMDDLYRAGVDEDFVKAASAKLKPGKFAIVADISEESEMPLDTEMAKYDGTVLRAPMKDVETEQMKKDEEATKEEIDQLEKEASKSSGGHKTQIQSKINSLKEKLRKQRAHVKQRSEEIKKEQEAKVHALEKKAANARGKAKTALNERLTKIRENYQKKRKEMEKSGAPSEIKTDNA